jgi:hypothetical protein
MGRRPKHISVEFGETTPLDRRKMPPPQMKQIFPFVDTLFGSTTHY